jgi:hypothetical protein
MTRRALPAGAAVLMAVASMTPAGGAGRFLTFVLDPDGVVYTWTEGDAGLSPLPPSLAHLAARPVNDLAVSEDGRNAVVLPVASHATGTRRNRLEGSAVVISTPTTAAQPAILNEINFEGDGRKVAVSRDGRLAYVLVMAVGPGTTGGDARVRLTALDLDEGRVLATASLDRPPSAILLDPTGERLYLAYAGRIQTYTTHPLAQSWHYRSPGANRGLCFRPHGNALYSARLDEIALFDPDVIAARKPEERQKLQDDATLVIPLPFAADSLLFSRDGTLAVAFGRGNVLVFIEPGTGTIVTASVDVALGETGQEVRPFYFSQEPGNLIVATFPGRRIHRIPLPAIHPAVVAESRSQPSSIATPMPHEESPPTPTPTPLPTPTPTPSPTPSAVESSNTSPVLAGRLSGRIADVRVIVIYGPGSIIREQGHAVPDADGSWHIPLPAPGSYRIVPLGQGSRPVRCEPNFHTLDVRDQGMTGIDFKILGTN